MAVTGKITALLALESGEFSAGMKRAEGDMKGFAAQSNRMKAQVVNNFRSLEASAKALTASLFSVNAIVGVLAGTAGMGLMMKNALSSADAIAKAADAAGIGTDALQKYRYAAGQSGVATETLDSALKKFSKNMGDLKNNTGSMKTVLKELSPEFATLLEKTTSTEQALKLMLAAATKIEDPMKRNSLLAAAFGRAGTDMSVMLKDGAQGMDALTQRAEDLGLVIEERLLRNAEEAGDRLDDLGQVISTNLNKALLEGADDIATIANAFTDAIPHVLKFAAGLAAVGTELANIYSATPHEAGAFEKLTMPLVKHGAAIAARFGDRASAIGSALTGDFAGAKSAWREGDATYQSVLAEADARMKGSDNQSAVARKLAAQKAAADNLKKKADEVNQSVGEAMAQLDGVLFGSGAPGGGKGAGKGKTGGGKGGGKSALEKALDDAAKLRKEMDGKLQRVVEQHREPWEALRATIADLEALRPFAETPAEFAAIEKGIKAANDEFLKTQALADESGKLFENAAERVQSSFSDAFFNVFRHGKTGFKDFADSLKDVFARTLAEMATLAIARPIIVPLVGAIGGLLGGGSAASGLAGQFGGSGGAGGMGMLSNLGSIGGLLSGGGGIAGAVNSWGSANLGTALGGGLQGPVQPGLFGLSSSASLMGVLGAGGLGFMGGGMLAGMLGGNSTGGSIGGGLGAAAGMFFGGPLGALAGGALGGALGGMFGPGKPTSAAEFGGTLSGGRFGNVSSAAKNGDISVARALAQQVGALADSLKALGINAAGGNLRGGYNTKQMGGGFFQLGDTVIKFDKDNAEDAARAMGDLAVLMAKSADVMDSNVAEALERITTEGRSLDEVLGDINFAATFKDLKLVEESSSAVEQQLQALNAAFDQAADTARRLGLEEAKVEQVRGQALAKMRNDMFTSTAGGILGLLDPKTAALGALNQQREAALKDAKLLGANIVQIEFYYGLQRQKIIEEYAASANETLTGGLSDLQQSAKALRLNILGNPATSGMSRENQLFEARRQFDLAKTGMLSGSGDFGAVQDSISNLLTASKEYYGSSEGFYQDQEKALSFLQRIEDGQYSANDNSALLLNEARTQTGLLQQMIAGGGGASGMLSMLSAVPDSALLKMGESAGVLNRTNGLSGISERITRAAKSLAGYNFAAQGIDSPLFADAVRNGTASGSIYNQLIAALGGRVQQFAGGGFPQAGLALVGERGPELVQFRGGERVYTASQSRGMMDSGAVVAELKAYRTQDAQQTQVLAAAVQALSAEITGLKRAIGMKGGAR